MAIRFIAVVSVLASFFASIFGSILAGPAAYAQAGGDPAGVVVGADQAGKMAVTTATLLGVAMPVMACGVETVLVDAGAPDPPQPASTPATAARYTMQRSLIRNLLNLMSNTSMSVTCWRPACMLGQSAAAMSVARPTIDRLSTRYLYLCGDGTRFTLGA